MAKKYELEGHTFAVGQVNEASFSLTLLDTRFHTAPSGRINVHEGDVADLTSGAGRSNTDRMPYSPDGDNKALRAELWEEQNRQCNGYRRAPHTVPLNQAVIDHIKPLRWGGSHQDSYLQVLCQDCKPVLGRPLGTAAAIASGCRLHDQTDTLPARRLAPAHIRHEA